MADWSNDLQEMYLAEQLVIVLGALKRLRCEWTPVFPPHFNSRPCRLESSYCPRKCGDWDNQGHQIGGVYLWVAHARRNNSLLRSTLQAQEGKIKIYSWLNCNTCCLARINSQPPWADLHRFVPGDYRQKKPKKHVEIKRYNGGTFHWSKVTFTMSAAFIFALWADLRGKIWTLYSFHHELCC